MLRSLLLLALMLWVWLPVSASPPLITWYTPANNTTYVAGSSVSVSSNAVPVDNQAIKNHRLYVNGVMKYDSGQQDLSYTVTGLQPGNHTFDISAKYFNGEEHFTNSRIIKILNPGEAHPSVALALPTGAPFIAPSTIGLSATASDRDGNVVKVQFFRDNVLIVTDSSSPYTATWSNVSAGTYSLTAKATDNSGNVSVSAARSLTISQSLIKGRIDAVSESSGQYYITGWACSTGRNESVQVHLYVGGPAGHPDRTFLGGYSANQTSDAGVAASCQASGTHYRFRIPLSGQARQAHANKRIYIHGISPVGSGNALLSNAGVLVVPPPLSVARHYYYDEHQRLCRSIEPETGSTVYQYDAAGNISWTASGLGGAAFPADGTCRRTEAIASGRVVEREYDARNRLETLRFPDKRGDQDWVYYPDGLPRQVTTVNVPGAVNPINQYLYNKRRLLITETQLLPAWYSYSIGYTYDALGNIEKLHYPSGMAVDFAPNALGQPTQAVGRWMDGLTDRMQTFASAVTYHPNGAIAEFKYGNQIIHRMIPNVRQLPETVQSFYGSTNILFDIYDYDQNGNVAAITDGLTDSPGNRTMHYDGLDRLRLVESPMYSANGGEVAYKYNGTDDLVEMDAPGRHHFYCYDAGRRLTNIKTDGCDGATVKALGYDPQGNLAWLDNQDFDFDHGNRLREVIGVERYRYDAHGRRILSMNFQTGTLFSQYAQSGQLLYQDNTRTGQMREIDHIYLGNSLVAQREVPIGGGAVLVKYQHTDALGSPVVVTNQQRVELERAKYEPYGQQLTVLSNTGNDRPGYTGHVEDRATGLTYMQQRYYDPGVGRFLSVDPVTALSDPVGYFGRYHYANNNPYTFTDPDGRAWGLAAKVVKVIVKGGDVAATFAGAVEDTKVLFSRDATGGQRLMAAGSLATEVASPVSARDVKAGIAAVDKASDAVHGNSKISQKLQHRYEIVDNRTGDVAKTGISGRDLNVNGTSGRANSQVNALNRAEGEGTYSARVVETNLPGRQAALDAESAATARLREAGNDLPLQRRP